MPPLNNYTPLNGTRYHGMSGLFELRPESAELVIEAPRLDLQGIPREAALRTSKDAGGQERIAEVRAAILDRGCTEPIAQLTERLGRSALGTVQRLLLSLPGVYAHLVLQALEAGVKPEDVSGMQGAILRRLDTGDDSYRFLFARHVVNLVLESRHIPTEDVADDVYVIVRDSEIPLSEAKLVPFVLRVHDEQLNTHLPIRVIEKFAARGEVDPSRFTPQVKSSMVEHLVRMGVKFDPAKIHTQRYDEYIAAAYLKAVESPNGGATDPIDAVRRKGVSADWDFRVAPFSGVDEQGIVPENIRAAGALDYVYQLGDRIGIFAVTDAIILAWGRGDLDLESRPMSGNGQDAPALLFRYHKLRNERSTPEERGMLYRRILDKGDANLLRGMQANRPFTRIWGKLLREVARFIERNEQSSDAKRVSRQPIYEALRQLQVNLTENMTGMAHLQVTEMYHQLLECRTILENEQIMGYFAAGRRKSIWTVVDRVKRELLEKPDMIADSASAALTVAVESNRIFELAADFDPATFTEAQLETLLAAGEAVIIAESVLAGQDQGGEEEVEEEEEIEEESDEDAGWDD